MAPPGAPCAGSRDGGRTRTGGLRLVPYFRVNGHPYGFVLGWRPGDETEEGDWIGGLERDCGFPASVLGGRKRGILPEAAEQIHAVLAASPDIRDIRWHIREDFDAGREDLGRTEP